MKRPADAGLWLLAASAILPWGASFLVNKLVLAELGPATLSLYRWLLAAIVFGVYAVATRRHGAMLATLRRRPVLFIALGVLCLPVPYLAQNYALKWTSVINVSVLMDADPAFIVILGALILRERVTALQGLGVLIALAGAALITTGGGSLQLGSHDAIGNLLSIVAAFSWATYTLLIKVAAREHDSATMMVLPTMVGTALLIPPAVVEGLRWPAETTTVAGVVFLGLLCSAWGTMVWIRVLQRMDASRAAPLIFLIPVIASILSFAFLGERPTPITIVSAALILGGVLISERNGLKVRHEPLQIKQELDALPEGAPDG